VTQQITVTAGDLAWLPTAGRPNGVSTSGLGVDQATGDLINPAGRPELAAYTATSMPDQPTEAQIAMAIPVSPADRGGPALPPRVRAFAEATVGGVPAGADQLLALRDRLATGKDFRYDQAEEVDGGHGLYQIDRLLQRKRGTSEQYASAFAVMARYLGYDARVVMGFRPEYDRDHPTSFVVTGRDVDAWAEVCFAGLGWVTFDPSPRANPIGTRADAPPPTAAQTNPVEPDDEPDSTTEPAATADQRPAAEGTADGAGSGPRQGFIIAGTAVLVLLCLALAAPVTKTIIRHRRRRGGGARQIILGAWRDTVDRLREAGIPAAPALTTGDVLALVRHSGSTVRMPAFLPDLAAMADRAGFAPEDPLPSLATTAWMAATMIRREVRDGMRPLHRMRATFDPRPLRSAASPRRQPTSRSQPG
jgi:transglutaminase superfamily protein